MRARVLRPLNIRTLKPEILPFNNPGNKYYNEGDIIEIAEEVIGEEYKGNKNWYKLIDGSFVWSGGTSIIKEETVVSNLLKSSPEIGYPPQALNWNQQFWGIPKELASFKGKGIKVAVLDDGLAADHDDLKNAFTELFDVTNNTGDDSVLNVHGTAIAGIIGARPSAKGITGVAPECTIIPIRIYRPSDHPVENLIKGIKKAVQEGANIINISYSFQFNAEADKLIHDTAARGILFIASGGDQRELTKLTFPASNSSVISVGACAPKVITAIKNDISEALHFVGSFNERWVCSTLNKKFYATDVGSSFCCAYVSGLVALLLSSRKAGGEDISKIKRDDIIKELETFFTDYTDERFISEPHFAFDSIKRIKQTV